MSRYGLYALLGLMVASWCFPAIGGQVKKGKHTGRKLSSSIEEKQLPPNCIITVTTIRRTGDRKDRVFSLHLDTKADCGHIGELHRNSSKRHVRIEWVDSDGPVVLQE